MLLVVLALLGLHAIHAQGQVYRQTRELIDTIETPSISFFWMLGVNDLGQRQIERCSQPRSLAVDNQQSPATTAFPLYLTLFPVGLQPTVQLAMEGPQLGFFDWEANLPVGTNFSIAMTDSSNPPNSGGLVDGFYIIDGTDNCTDAQPARRALTAVIDPTDYPCDEIAVRTSGGTPPFTASLLSGTSGLYGNMTGITTSQFSLYNSIPSGQAFTMFVTDSTGLSSNVSSIMTSGFGSANCNRPGAGGNDGGGVPLGAIIGGAIGGVIAAILLALLAWWLLKRRANRAHQEYAASELATKGEFRMADGTVPLVKPFVVPHRSSDSEATPSPTSAGPSFSPHEYAYNSPYGPPLVLPPPSSYSGSQQASPTSPASVRNYPPYGDESTYLSHPYESTSGSHPYESAQGSTSGIALADPEEFSYREAGWSPVSASATPSLPRGAAPPS